MGVMASQITGLTSVYSTVDSGVDQRKHQSSASLAGTGEFPAQMASNAENVSIWWRHHVRDPPITVDSPYKGAAMQILLFTVELPRI